MFNNNLSILILTHNFLGNTKKCISSLYSYTSGFELVIVDNASSDGTEEYIKELEKRQKNVVVHINKENNGVIKGRNQAYFLSDDSKEYFIFLDNDQYVLNNWLDGYEALFNRGYHVVGTEAWKMRTDFFPLAKVVNTRSSYNYVGCGSMMIKGKVIKDIGLFDERYNPMYFEDPHFCWQAEIAGYKIGWNAENVIQHEPHNLLGKDPERKQYFYNSLSKFRDCWKGHKMPVFKMTVI